jgi:hypothetical protein
VQWDGLTLIDKFEYRWVDSSEIKPIQVHEVPSRQLDVFLKGRTKWQQEHRDFQIAFGWVVHDKVNDSEFPCSMGTYENFSHSVVERFNEPSTEASK